jgi:hypothetical protein
MFDSRDPNQLSSFKKESIAILQEHKHVNSTIKWDSKLSLHAVYYRNEIEAIRHGCLNKPDETGLVFGYEKGFKLGKPSYRTNN